MSIKHQTINGIKWTSFSAVVTSSVQFAQLYFVAMLLDPHAVGLMATIMIVIGFSQIFVDFGISNAIIQRQDVTSDQLSSLYWLNIALGFSFSLIVVAIAPLIADFYDSSDLLYPTMLSSLLFIFQSFGSQYKILFQKDMEFNLIAKIETLTILIASSMTIAFAIFDFGVYALILGMLINALASSVLFVISGIKLKHRPKLSFIMEDVRPFLSFGLYQIGEKTINYFSSNIDRVLVAKFIGVEAAGLYDMAWKLIMYPSRVINPIVNKVAFPLYSKIKSDQEMLHKYFLTIVKMLTLLTIPILIFLSFNSDNITLILLGEKWSSVAGLVKVLSFVGLVRAIGNPGGALLLSLGHVKVGFWWNLFWGTTVSIVLFITAIYFPTLDSISFALLGTILTFGSIWHVLIAKYSHVSYKSICVHLVKMLFIIVTLAWLCKKVVESIFIDSIYISLFGNLFLFLMIYLIIIFSTERNFFKLLIRKS